MAWVDPAHSRNAKVHQQTTKNCFASGDWSEVESLVENEELEFKVDLRSESRKMKNEWGKFRNGSRTKSLLEDVGKAEKIHEVQRRVESHNITDWATIELHEMGQLSRTVQCHPCLKHIPEGLTFCSCGICLRFDEATTPRIPGYHSSLLPCTSDLLKRQEAWRSSWQRDHWKAMYAKSGAKKHEKDTITANGWTEEYCRYLDYLTTIDISYTASWHQRHIYESTMTLACNDEDLQAGPMKATGDFKPTTKILTSLRKRSTEFHFS